MASTLRVSDMLHDNTINQLTGAFVKYFIAFIFAILCQSLLLIFLILVFMFGLNFNIIAPSFSSSIIIFLAFPLITFVSFSIVFLSNCV